MTQSKEAPQPVTVAAERDGRHTLSCFDPILAQIVECFYQDSMSLQEGEGGETNGAGCGSEHASEGALSQDISKREAWWDITGMQDTNRMQSERKKPMERVEVRKMFLQGFL
eukprot:765653-Hanusia_phi.AAC.2